MTVPQKVNAADRSPVQQQQDDEQPTAADGNRQFGPRSYQQDLIELATDNNVLISLATSAGKTLIAAEVIRRKLPALKAATKAVLFMAPTNPLVAQQADVALCKTYGFRTKAYHGSVHHSHITQWDRQRWIELLQEIDVLVMTPDVLLHTLSHGVFKISDIGLLIFDEAHHCKSDHPYNQLMQDFYHPLPASERPQVLGLTASPEGMEQDTRKRKQRTVNMGLQYNLNAWLITVPEKGPLRGELDKVVPKPTTHFTTFDARPAVGVIGDSLSWLNWTKEHLLRPAKRCEAICEMLRGQELLAHVGLCESRTMASFENFTEGGRVAALDKQIRGVIYCLEHLGPWCAAAAAYLDLLAPPSAAEEEAAAAEQAALEASGNVWTGEEEDTNPVLVQGGDTCRVFEDELGGPPELLLAELRKHLGGIVQFLQLHAEQPGLTVIVTQAEIEEALTPRRQDLPAAAAAARAAAEAAAEAMEAMTSDPAVVEAAAAAAAEEVELEWCARGLLKLAAKVALLITMNVLADVLVDDQTLKKQLMNGAGEDPSCRDLERRSSGSLQGFAESLLRRVPFNLLEAQVWPHTEQAAKVRPWHGPPLLTDKVVKLLRLLESDRQRCLHEEALLRAASAATDPNNIALQEEWWACMVFVETKLSALVLSKLLSSLPTMRRHLRAGYLLGDTRSDKTGSLAMNNKQQALVVSGFRSSAINVLIATSVGSEGMDFRQCQLVVAFDLPKDVTSYIQCRGRARKRGSRYCFMQGTESPHSIQHIIVASDELELRALEIAAANRQRLAEAGADAESLVPRPAPEEEDSNTRLSTPCGAAVTTRLAQKMLADYCGKLPGCDRATILQPYYSTCQEEGMWFTTVYLPSNCGIDSKVEDAPPAYTSKASKQQAALHALRLLYQAGKLNDHLQPVWITQRHSKQLEAEPTPQAMCHIRLRRPLQPRPLSLGWHSAPSNTSTQQQQQQQQQPGSVGSSHAASPGSGCAAVSAERVITLHLHTFVYGKVAQKAAAAAGSSGGGPGVGSAAAVDPLAADAFSTALGSAEAALMAAVVGTDEALAALPGGPVVAGGMEGKPISKLCFGVLLWEPLHTPDLMKWPVWIEKQLYIMDVVYEGPLQLTESQINTLLGYQNPINKFINWNITRSQWLKTARGEEAAVIAEAPIKVQLVVQEGGHVKLKLQVWEPLPPAAEGATAAAEAGTSEVGDGTAAGGSGPAAAGAAADVDKQQQHGSGPDAAGTAAAQQQGVGQTGTGDDIEDEDMTSGPEAGSKQQDDSNAAAAAPTAEDEAAAAAAAAAQAAQEQLARQPLAFKPRLLEELVRFKRAKWPHNSSTSATAAAGGADDMQVDGPDADAEQQQEQVQSASTATDAFLHEAADDWAPAQKISYLIVPLKNAADVASTANSSSGQEDPQHIRPEAYPSLNIKAAGLDPSWKPAIDWAKIRHMGEGVLPLPALVAQALGLQQYATQTPQRMVLPPEEPPAAVPQELYEAAAAAGQPPPLAGAATMTPLPPELKPDAVSKLEAALRGRLLVAGHSSQVYSALGVAAGLTPSSSLSQAVAGLVERYGMTGTAAAGLQNDLATFAPLLAQDNPEMAAAVMLSANLVDKDPEQRPMLGWKLGKTEDGKPIWHSSDRHDDYYRLRFCVTGLRPDVPMLAVKSSRGLTDCCLLPPRVEVSSLVGPLPEVDWQQHAAGAAAAATPASAAAAKASNGAAAGGSTAAGSSVAVGSKRQAGDTASDPTPDKRRLVQQQQQQSTAGAIAGAGSSLSTSATASTANGAGAPQAAPAGAGGGSGAEQQQQGLVLEKRDRLADWEHDQQQLDQFAGLTQEQLDEAGKRLAAMSSSARRKAWAQHRVMFLPLELGWVLPLTSPEWSQLQLVPNIVYRIDSMLQASSMHRQLWELLRGGGPKAATQVFNYPLPPEREDESTAKEMGWLPPDPVRSLLTDYTITVDLPPLFDESEMLQPDSPAAPAAAAPGTAAATSPGEAPGSTDERRDRAAADAVGAAGVGSGGDASHSSLPAGLAAQMRTEATPLQVRHSVAAAAAAAAVANGAANGAANGHHEDGSMQVEDAEPQAAAGGTKRARSPSGGGSSETLVLQSAAENGTTTPPAGPSASSQQQQQQQAEDGAGVGDGSGQPQAGGTPGSPAPASKKSRTAAAAGPVPEALKVLPPGQQPPAAATLPTLAERRAQLAAVPMPSRTLMLMALTCASCHEAFDFERLEFLGDVILKALAAHVMLGAMPGDANEGELSVAKAQVVRNVRLARLGRSKPLLLQYQLRMHPFDNCLWTPNGCNSVLGLFDNGPQTTFKGKRLADGIEALIGAFYLSGAAAEAAQNTAAAAAAGSARNRPAAGQDSEIYGVEEPSVPAMLDAASWVWHRVSQPGLEAAAALCEVLEVLPQGALELIRRSPMQLVVSPPDKASRSLRASAAAAAAASSAASSLSKQLTEKLADKMGNLMGGPFPYTFRDPSWLVQSLTHVSVLGGVSYQRLEFLGDALMDLIVSLRLLAMGHGTQRHHGPAELTKARASSVANLTMARASVLAGLHQLIRCNSWRLLYTTHRFAQEVIAKHADTYPDWRPYCSAEELELLQQQHQQQQGDAAAAAAAGNGQPGSAAVADGAGGNSCPAVNGDVEMADAGGGGDAVQGGNAVGKQGGKWSGSAAAAIAASAAVAAAAAENCSLEQLAPLTPLGAVSAAALQQRLAASCPDDDTIWLAVWLRKKELAALHAVSAEIEAARAAASGGQQGSPSGAASAGQAGASSSPAAGGDTGDEEQKQEEGSEGSQEPASGKAPKKKCPKVMADLVESLVAAVFIDSGCDWGKTWAAAEYLLWREGVVELPPVNLPEDPTVAAAAAVAAAVAAAKAAAAGGDGIVAAADRMEAAAAAALSKAAGRTAAAAGAGTSQEPAGGSATEVTVVEL